VRIEHGYRIGRSYEPKGDIVNVIESYRFASLISSKEDPYFHCNVSLRLEILHELKDDAEFAYSYFKQCLNINPPVFTEAIHLEVKAGIERLKNR
jgi:hypothetical protein